MQERRTDIRVPHMTRAQYCASTDLIPRDGRLTNLSERGAGMWAREPHAAEERVTLTFVLPGDEEPLTATGIVRWGSDQAVRKSWYPLGVEWLPLEETMRYRVRSFLKHQAEVSAQQTVEAEHGRFKLGWMARAVWIPLGVLCVVLALLVGIVQVRRESRRLGLTLQMRDTMIRVLEADRTSLQQALGMRTHQLTASAQELARLDMQIRQLQDDLERTQGEATAYKGSYVLVSEERQRLLGRMEHLQQEREELAWKLRMAIRALVTPQKDAVAPRPQPEQISSRIGNQGYLIRDSKPTPLTGTAWIRVLTPELGTSRLRKPSNS